VPRLTEDQQLLAQSAGKVLGSGGSARFRSLRDQGAHIDSPLWDQLIELGWPAIPFPEAAGGLGWGLPEVAIVMEALGRNLSLTPMLSTVLGGMLDPAANPAGGQVVALAWQEAERDGLDLGHCDAAVTDGVLKGRKICVLDGRAADSFVVTAVGGGKPGLYRVSAEFAAVTPLLRIDHRDAAHVSFQEAPAERLDTTLGDVLPALEWATVALAAEMLGGAQAALDATVAHLKERIQFDVPIGSFQALQHRCVDCFIEIEMARAAVHAASRTPSTLNVSLAKTRCNDAYLHVAKEAIQLHGGIGMTDEHDIGFHLKRAQVASQTLGTSAWHRDRWGRLRGY